MKHARVALALAIASAISVALIFPYLLAAMPKLAATRPLWLLVAAQVAQAGVLSFCAAWVGLRLGAPLGLDAPLLRAWAYRSTARAATQFRFAAAVGMGVGALVVLIDRLVFMPWQPDAIRELETHVARWKGLLACFYGGIPEEVLTRLFVMSSVAWLLSKLMRRRTPALFIAAALVSAVALAAGHLPAAAQLAPLSCPVVTRVLVLNTLAGIPFALLFWRYGLEHAMLAHFCADLVLHVVMPFGH